MIVTDSSVLVALINEDDNQHEKALKILADIYINRLKLFDFLYIETLSVLRLKKAETDCVKFINFLDYFELALNLSTQETIELANKYFFQFIKLSFTDCLVMAGAKIHKAQIITFDKNLQKAWNQLSKA